MATTEKRISFIKDTLRNLAGNKDVIIANTSQSEYDVEVAKWNRELRKLKNASKNDDVETPETEANGTSRKATSFNNDQLYEFVENVGDLSSEESKTENNYFRVLKDRETRYNVARNNTFLVSIDFYRNTTSKYVNVITSDYITNIKAPFIRVKENGTVSMGAYEVDLSVIKKSGDTLTVDVNENDNRGVIKDILDAISVYQDPSNHSSGVYSDIRKTMWKIHHDVYDYKGNLKLMAKYICTPVFNIDSMMEYENIKAEDYTLDFKVVNYNIYDENGTKIF